MDALRSPRLTPVEPRTHDRSGTPSGQIAIGYARLAHLATLAAGYRSSCLATSVNSAPWAAPEPLRPALAPRRTNATATGSVPPTIGPATYTQQSVNLPPTRSGPNVRAGFIGAPEIGLPHNPARAM